MLVNNCIDIEVNTKYIYTDKFLSELFIFINTLIRIKKANA